MIRSKLGKFLAKVLLMLSSILVCLVVVEGGYRVHRYGLRSLSPSVMNGLHSLGRAGIMRAAEPPELGYELKPDVRSSFKLAAFETNSRGLRDQEYSLEKPPGTRRIAVIGDSFTMGSGVDIEDVYHSVLEDLINRDPGGARTECLNFGVGGYGLREYLAVFEHRTLDYEPDLILLALTQTDKTPSSNLPFKDKPVSLPFWELHSLTALRADSADMRRSGEFGQEAALPAPKPPRASGGSWEAKANFLPPPTMKFIRLHFASLAKLSKRTGVPVAVVFLRARSQEFGAASIIKSFRLAAKEVGFPFLNTSELFEGSDGEEFRILPTDNHPNAEANAIFAAAIHGFLAEEGLLGR